MVLDGTQPVNVQSPPMGPDCTSNVRAPRRWASREAVRPAAPPPTTTTSKRFSVTGQGNPGHPVLIPADTHPHPARRTVRPRIGFTWSVSARIVTDSNTMVPAGLVNRFDLTVVSLHVVVDGQDHLETGLDQREFCDALRSGATVTTAAPSPGELAAAHEALAADGATEILSVHIGSNRSATVEAARLAARDTELPVTVVDTGTTSFMAGC